MASRDPALYTVRPRFNIARVDDRLLTTESARHRGREAFFAGEPRESCPFPEDSGERLAWTGAWEAARDYRVWLDIHIEREA